MPVSHGLRDQIAKIDEQIIHLINQRITLCQEARDEDAEAMGPADQAEMLAEWEGAADERGWSMGTIGRICKGIADLCRTAE